jgi:hypothetical protein
LPPACPATLPPTVTAPLPPAPKEEDPPVPDIAVRVLQLAGVRIGYIAGPPPCPVKLIVPPDAEPPDAPDVAFPKGLPLLPLPPFPVIVEIV